MERPRKTPPQVGHLCTCQGPSDSLVTLVPKGQALSSPRKEDRKRSPRQGTLDRQHLCVQMATGAHMWP